MWDRWVLSANQFGKALCVMFMLCLQSKGCSSLNLEGLALMEFRSKVELDPHGTLENWSFNDEDPCTWVGVRCINGKVDVLNLNDHSLKGVLVPELGKLSHMRALVLYKNNFSGVIPKEIGALNMLEVLDLRDNNFSGLVPAEIVKMPSLKHLLLSNSTFQGSVPCTLVKFGVVCQQQGDKAHPLVVGGGISCINRKVRHCFWQSSLQQLKKANSFMIPMKEKVLEFLDSLSTFKVHKQFSRDHREKPGANLKSFTEQYAIQEVENAVTNVGRVLLEANNLPAATVAHAFVQDIADVPSTGSGSFPAIVRTTENTNVLQTQSAPVHAVSTTQSVSTSEAEQKTSQNSGKWTYILAILIAAVLLVVSVSMLLMDRTRGSATVRDWRTGLSGPLQKALLEGVPKLNRTELEAACEDFSNIIQTYPDCTVFKGTLSSGVEISVMSTVISSYSDWSRHAQTHFRKKIDTLSRVNHKNFVNLLGYCEEDVPFTRMMVFEYAPSGTLFEHLHVKGLEHLDWNARMRIIMGIAYCLQYMHHELNPPVAHPNIQSNAVFLTDDFAAKFADMDFWKEVTSKEKLADEFDTEMQPASPGSNVYDFGALILEIVSGKMSYSEEHGSIVDWASEYFKDKGDFSCLTDPSLKSIKNNQLDALCEVVYECVYQDPKKRPTMDDVTTKLREVLAISPDSATPKLSPLWWAELEILSVEAT